MNWTVIDPDLHFEQRPRPLPLRAIVVGVGLSIFTLLWVFIPSRALYWLLLPFLAVLLWVASYGWRQALAALIRLLRRLEQF